MTSRSDLLTSATALQFAVTYWPQPQRYKSQWPIDLSHSATSRKDTGWIPDSVTGIFHRLCCHNFPGTLHSKSGENIQLQTY